MIRLFLGAALIIAAKNSTFPTALEVSGWLILLAGIALAVIGRKKFMELVKWALSLIPQYSRAIGLFAILFSGLLGYSVL